MILIWLLTESKLENGNEGVKKEASQHDLEKCAVNNSCFSHSHQVNNVILIEILRLFSIFELLIVIFIMIIMANFNLFSTVYY